MLDKDTTLPTLHSEANRGKSVGKQAAEGKEEANKGSGGVQRHVMRISYTKGGRQRGIVHSTKLSRDEQAERVQKKADFLPLKQQMRAQGS